MTTARTTQATDVFASVDTADLFYVSTNENLVNRAQYNTVIQDVEISTDPIGGFDQDGESVYPGAQETLIAGTSVGNERAFVVSLDGLVFGVDFANLNQPITAAAETIDRPLRLRADIANKVLVATSFENRTLMPLSYDDIGMTAIAGPAIDLGDGNNPVGIDVKGIAGKTYVAFAGFDSGRFFLGELDVNDLASFVLRSTQLPAACVNPSSTVLFGAETVGGVDRFSAMATCNGSSNLAFLNFEQEDLDLE